MQDKMFEVLKVQSNFAESVKKSKYTLNKHIRKFKNGVKIRKNIIQLCKIVSLHKSSVQV